MAELSLVVPVYNEAKVIGPNLKTIVEYLEKEEGSFEVIIGNDGSTDDTLDIITLLAVADPRLRVISNATNQGRGAILTRTMLQSKGRLVGYIDADLEIDIAYLRPLTDLIRSGYDIAIGSKNLPGHEVKRLAHRAFAHTIYHRLVKWLLGLDVADAQGGIKLFRREVLQDVLPSTIEKGWVWDTEVLVRAKQLGYRIGEVPIEISPQRVSRVAFISDSVKSFCSLLRLYMRGVTCRSMKEC